MANITQRGNAYTIRVSAGYDINGKKILRNMTWKPEPGMTAKQIKKELERQAILFEEKVITGQTISSDIRFAAFAEKWMNEYAKVHLRSQTVAQYEALLPRVNAAIGNIKLEKIQPNHLLQFYNNLAEKGIRLDTKYICTVDLKAAIKEKKLTFKAISEKVGISEQAIASASKGNNVSKKTAEAISSAMGVSIKKIFKPIEENKTLSGKTLQHYHRLISSIMTTAVQWQVIPSNPCNRIKPPKAERKEAEYLNEQQAIDLLIALDEEPIMYRTLYTLILNTGLRRGEACGLEWSDIDLEHNIIDINKSSLYLPSKGVYDDDTKNTSSHRVLKIPDYAADLLREYKRVQTEERLKLGDKWTDSGKVFTAWNGKPIHPSTVTNWFSDFVKRRNLPSVHVHSLRHTNATLMIFNGINIKTVSSRLGHSNVTTTGNIYTHAIKTADERAAESLADIFSLAKSKNA